MATYSPSELGHLLQQWSSGNLNNIVSPGHVVAGVPDVVLTGSGFRAMSLAQRYTVADIDQAIAQVFAQDSTAALMLVCIHLLNWRMDRLGRALEHPDTSYTQTCLLMAEDLFAEVLLNAN